MVALALAAFMLLAACRSIVPNLCATQKALDAGTAELCETSSCCAPKPIDTANGPRVKGPQTDNPDCAFCYLAASLTEHSASVAVEPGFPDATAGPLRAASVWQSRELDGARFGRAPPA